MCAQIKNPNALHTLHPAIDSILDRYYWHPCTIRILMLTDTVFGGYNNEDFHLGELIHILKTNVPYYVNYKITKAHRDNVTTVGADITQFRFDNSNHFNPDDYDEIWMFGIQGGNNINLSAKEQRIVAEFMERHDKNERPNGGGVFCTGDHEHLGTPLSVGIPRVRNMRKWYYGSAFTTPYGEPKAPPGDGPDRHDTLVEGHDSGYQFDDQSDDIPQKIQPRFYYSRANSPFIFTWNKYPHPLLCGPHGVIDVMPDHAHEGECYEPSDLNRSFTYDGETFVEYPTAPNGHKPRPQVIAWSNEVGPRTAADVKGNLNLKKFGSICAYNGHEAEIGRVVVDATWHHFFNINLKGELFNSDPVKAGGFKGSASPQAQKDYDQIKAYFRNIAIWLAPQSKQRCMLTRTLWLARWNTQIAIDLGLHDLHGPIKPSKWLNLTSGARDVLGRLAPRCNLMTMIVDWLIPTQISYFNLWTSDKRAERRGNFDPELVIWSAAAGALMALAERWKEPPGGAIEADDHKFEIEVMEVIQEGGRLGVKRLMEFLRTEQRKGSYVMSRVLREMD